MGPAKVDVKIKLKVQEVYCGGEGFLLRIMERRSRSNQAEPSHTMPTDPGKGKREEELSVEKSLSQAAGEPLTRSFAPEETCSGQELPIFILLAMLTHWFGAARGVPAS